MADGWHGLIGKPGQLAGTAGTATVPSGAVVIMITVHSTAGGSFTIFGGPSIAVIANAAPLQIQFNHTLFQATSASNTLVFTSTDHYWVHYVQQSTSP